MTFSPMLASEAPPSDLTKFIEDDEWAMDLKLDGHRILWFPPKTTSHIGGVAIGRNGQISQHNGLLHREPYQWLLGNLNAIIDCELIDNKLWIFDLLGPNNLLNAVYQFRRRAIEVNFPLAPGDELFGIVPGASDHKGKAELALFCLRTGGEGVVFKRKDGYYEPGVRSRNVVKVKFVKEFDAVVTGLGFEGKNNAVLGVFRDRKLVEVGRCSLNGKEPVDTGDVLTVRYLKLGAGDRVTQPRMIRRRHDKSPDECTFDQFIIGDTLA